MYLKNSMHEKNAHNRIYAHRIKNGIDVLPLLHVALDANIGIKYLLGFFCSFFYICFYFLLYDQFLCNFIVFYPNKDNEI